MTDCSDVFGEPTPFPYDSLHECELIVSEIITKALSSEIPILLFAARDVS